MSRLSDLYKAMDTLRKEGISINEELEKQVSELEENIIKTFFLLFRQIKEMFADHRHNQSSILINDIGKCLLIVKPKLFYIIFFSYFHKFPILPHLPYRADGFPRCI